MAENKKSFILYADQKSLFNDLTNEEAGELIKHIFSYVNDENPTLNNRLLQIAFSPIKQQLKRDLVKYEVIKTKRSDAGKKGMKTRWENADKQNSVIPHEPFTSNKFNVDDLFKSLINGNEINEISRVTKIPLDTLKSKIEPFRKYAELEYSNYGKFTNHFKNWVLKNNNQSTMPSLNSIKLGKY